MAKTTIKANGKVYEFELKNRGTLEVQKDVRKKLKEEGNEFLENEDITSLEIIYIIKHSFKSDEPLTDDEANDIYEELLEAEDLEGNDETVNYIVLLEELIYKLFARAKGLTPKVATPSKKKTAKKQPEKEAE